MRKTVSEITAEPGMDIVPVEEPAEEPVPVTRFSIGPSQVDNPAGYKVRSDYCEEHWIAFIGPSALVIARKMDNLLASSSSSAVSVKMWSAQLGITEPELVAAVRRLARYGLGEWVGDAKFLLRRHWPEIPAAITTPRHKRALLDLPD